MLKNLSHGRVIAVWFVAVAVTMAMCLILGATATPSTWALLLLVSLMPPAISLVIWRGAPAPTMAQVLHAARQEEGRMIVPYSRFLERRAERDSVAAARRFRDEQRTVDVESVPVAEPAPGAAPLAAERVEQAVSSEKRFT